MATAPPPVTPLPTPPSTSDPANFDTRADAFLGALPDFQTETDALAVNVYDNTVLAETAQAASTAAALVAEAAENGATASANATLWVSGTYAAGVCVFSPITWATYRRTSASPGASAADPSTAPALWTKISGGELPTQEINSNTTAVLGVHYLIYGNCTLSLPAISGGFGTVGVTVFDGVTAAVVAPDGTDKIRGVAGNMNVDNAPFQAFLKDTGAAYGWV